MLQGKAWFEESIRFETFIHLVEDKAADSLLNVCTLCTSKARKIPQQRKQRSLCWTMIYIPSIKNIKYYLFHEMRGGQGTIFGCHLP